ncbi:MAG: RlmE family RNA methyltransferase [Deltaproteobacteria bacterium]|nr:RlmE family RNA methyltransferase [Deltaproteobacteria bacterium]
MSGKYRVKDHLFHKAKQEGYRSRAAYKLEELDDKYHFLKLGGLVLDLGCSPGGWLQVAASRVGPKGKVVGVDLKPVPEFKANEIAGSYECISAKPVVIVGDILSSAICGAAVQEFGGKVDVVLSDMSPNLSGIRDRDVMMSVKLVEATFQLASEFLKAGGTVVAKIFPGQESDELYRQLKLSFPNIRRVELKASKKTSKEFYLIARK